MNNSLAKEDEERRILRTEMVTRQTEKKKHHREPMYMATDLECNWKKPIQLSWLTRYNNAVKCFQLTFQILHQLFCPRTLTGGGGGS